MKYIKPNYDAIDIYCCQNPNCRKRIRIYPAGETPTTHCEIRLVYLATWPKKQWDEAVHHIKTECDHLTLKIIGHKRLAAEKKLAHLQN